MRWPLLLIVASIAGLTASALAHAAAPLTKIEARTLPPEKVKHRVIEQLDEILLPEPRHTAPGRPVRPLTEMMLRTRPHATHIAGLCESDSVTVEFGPTGPAAEPVETPVKAIGLQARHTFRFLAPPQSLEPKGKPWDDRAAADRQCAGLDSSRERFFEADQAEVAAEAAWLYLQVVAGLGQASPPFNLECLGGFDCARDFAPQLGPDDLENAERCDGEPLKNIGCWHVMAGANPWVELKIYATNGGTPTISRVVISEPIVMADDRID